MSLFNSTLYHPQTYFFDSGERTSGDSGSFSSSPINLDITNPYDSVVVNQVVIPKSWYNVPQNYNTFTLTEDGVDVLITITPANYNKNNLIPVLQNLLNAASPNGLTYTITYPDIATQGDTGKYTFTAAPAGIHDIYFTFNNQSMFQQMGFYAGSTNQFDPILSTIESTTVLNFQIISSIFIISDMSVEDDVLQEVYSVGTILSSSYIFYQQVNFDLNTKRLLTSNNNTWKFTLLDQLDRIINLNGQDWQVSIIFYHRNDYDQMARQYLQIKNYEKIIENEKILKTE